MARLTDRELVSICDSGIRGCIGSDGELASDRALAMQRYLGEELGNEIEDRSQIRTREVLEVIEKALPSLIRIFALEDNAVVFEPEGQEDEEAARQETAVIRHVFWQLANGYDVLYSLTKDGLISKNGIAKVYWQDRERESRETYRGLSPIEREALLSQDDVEVEVVSETEREDGTLDIEVIVTRPAGAPHIDVVPPEDFGVTRGHRSLLLDDATFVYHRARMTLGQLVAMGFSRSKIEHLTDSGETTEEEQIARYNLEDDLEDTSEPHWSMRRVWVTEAYPLVDRDDDGVPERLKVMLVGSGGSYTLLSVEEVDQQPFVAWSPVPLTHKFVGLSLADLTIDLQEIKTQLTRGVLDNLYLANNGRTAINDRVDIDDMMVLRPGSLVRIDGFDPPGNNFYQFQYPPPPPQVFEMLGYLDGVAKSRTGIGDPMAGLDIGALANINTGVAAMAMDNARLVLELIARNLAEYAVRPLFEKLHELMRKRAPKSMALRIQGKWTPVAPQEWRERENLAVHVGIGNVSREQRAAGLTQVIAMQREMLLGGLGTMAPPEKLYESITDLVDLLVRPGAAAQYFVDPRQVPPQPPQPDTKLLELQARAQSDAAKIQIDGQRLQLESEKLAMEATFRQAELAMRAQEQELKARVDRMQAEAQMRARAMDEQSEIMNARAELEARQLEARQQEINGALKAQELALRADTDERKLVEARYEAELAAAVEMWKEQHEAAMQELAAMRAKIGGTAT